MIPILPHDEHQRTLEDGRAINDRTRREFFQAIADARPQRIKNAMRTFSCKQLEKEILKMERYGCYGQAEEYEEALRRKRGG